jgi:hypothetical protein
VVTLQGTGGVVGATTITLSFSDLNAPTGVYGCNAPYSVNGGTPTPGITNDVYGWIVGDLLAGMNLGFPGSSTTNPQTGTPLGQCTSSQWFAAAQADPSLQFGGAQSDSRHYNAYAGALLPLTSAYGFPFSDRVGSMLLPFPPDGSGAVDYVVITLLPNQTPPSPQAG